MDGLWIRVSAVRAVSVQRVLGTGLFVAAVFGAAVAPTVYSWLFYRRQASQRGSCEKTKSSRKASRLSPYCLSRRRSCLSSGCCFPGICRYGLRKDGFTVDASGWRDYTVQYADIESVTYEPEGVSDGESDRRTNGFGNLKMSMGHFYNDRFGDYIRYTFHDCAACVVLRAQGGIVVLNGEDEASTEEMYQTLQERIR